MPQSNQWNQKQHNLEIMTKSPEKIDSKTYFPIVADKWTTDKIWRRRFQNLRALMIPEAVSQWYMSMVYRITCHSYSRYKIPTREEMSNGLPLYVSMNLFQGTMSSVNFRNTPSFVQLEQKVIIYINFAFKCSSL